MRGSGSEEVDIHGCKKKKEEKGKVTKIYVYI
jgi:hypothetical protein